MSSKATFFSRLTNLITTRKRPIGYDLEGNRYFEAPDPNGGRMKRTVEYRIERDIADYTEGTRRLPVQWTTWLSHTRTKPPTMEELEADRQRQQSLGPMIAAIESRERAERIRQGYLIETPEGEVLPQIAGSSRSANGWTKAEGPLFRAAPSNAPSNERAERSTYPSASSSTSRKEGTNEYPVPTPSSPEVVAPRETADPATNTSPEDLRRLAMEDTKRRIKESGIEETGTSSGPTAPSGGSTGGDLQPRRRGGS